MIPALNSVGLRWLPGHQEVVRRPIALVDRHGCTVFEGEVPAVEMGSVLMPLDPADVPALPAGAVMMLNRTIEVGGGCDPYVPLPSVYRWRRAMTHAELREAARARGFKKMHPDLANALMVSQMLDHDDEDGWIEYTDLVDDMLARARMIVRRPEKSRLIDRLQRVLTHYDSMDRPNKCALVLIYRLLQRLTDESRQQAAQNSVELRSAVMSVDHLVSHLEQQTEWCATQLHAMSHAPWLIRDHGTLTRSQLEDYGSRLQNAYSQHLPDILAKLDQNNLVAPFADVYKVARSDVRRAQAGLRLRMQMGHGAKGAMDVQRRISALLLNASKNLARLMVLAEMEQLLLVVSTAVRVAKDAGGDSGICNATLQVRLPKELFNSFVDDTVDAVQQIGEQFQMNDTAHSNFIYRALEVLDLLSGGYDPVSARGHLRAYEERDFGHRRNEAA